MLKTTVFRCTRGARTQVFLRADLEDHETIEIYRRILPTTVRVVYSDPPWNPGNATYWRSHAGGDRLAQYDAFLVGWCGVAAECQRRGATDVLVEQSINATHANLLRAVATKTKDWTLPEIESWPVVYGSGAKPLPNLLIHYGFQRLVTNPEGMTRDAMTLRAVFGTGILAGQTMVDPCVGLGMSSRTAHSLDLDLVGSELNPERLARTIDWLRRQGYAIAESSP